MYLSIRPSILCTNFSPGTANSRAGGGDAEWSEAAGTADS